jgi:REP element-mobilizing transposase RayT
MKKQINYWQKFEEHSVYHIYNRCIKGEKLFRTDENYYFFLRKWNLHISPFANTLAYCLIPNHFHFLVQIKPMDIEFKLNLRSLKTVKATKFKAGEINYNQLLEDQFKRLFQSYALAINKQEKRYGSLFQTRFKRMKISDEYKIFHLIAYIHHNPIHHKIVADFKEWKFSSFQEYLSEHDPYLEKTGILEWLSDNHSTAIKLFKQYHYTFKKDKINEVSYLDY